MYLFTHETRLAVPRHEAFVWHERPGAFLRLAPPWEDIELISAGTGIGNDVEVRFRVRLLGPLWQFWHARHYGYVAGEQFADRQISGPFAHWEHVHRFEDTPDGGTVIRDRVEYRLPLEPLSGSVNALVVREKLRAMFAWRSHVVAGDLALHRRLAAAPMRVLISGASGLVGRTLVPLLQGGGHTPVALRRGAARPGDDLWWDPATGFTPGEAERLAGIDGVVHLAGEPILGVWTEAKKARIRESRVAGTRRLCEALARAPRPPRVLVCASAIGIYGDRPGETLDESSPAGEGFLADVARQWEEACAPARAAGIRVVNLRIGVVLSPRGGALAAMLPAFRFGLGGRLGPGTQMVSWIGIDDLAGLILHCLANPAVEGPVNGTAPHPVSNAELTRTLARVLSRPVGPPAPAFALRMAPGNMGGEVFLSSVAALPRRALDTGYQFRHADLEGCLRQLLGRTVSP